MIASVREVSDAGHADQFTALRPPGASPDWMLVAMIVIPIANTMETKSMYPKIAISVKDGGMARIRRIMAETTPKTIPQAPLSVMFWKAMVPVKQ